MRFIEWKTSNFIQISLRFAPEFFLTTLVQVMACHLVCAQPLPECIIIHMVPLRHSELTLNVHSKRVKSRLIEAERRIYA